MAAKPIDNRLGSNLTESQENSPGLAQMAAQPPYTVASALPLLGNLRPEVLLPVVVQPQLMTSTAYTAPHAGAARSRAIPIPGLVLRGREGP